MPDSKRADLKLEKKNIDGIPTLSCFKEGGEPKPLVIFAHDFTNSKEIWTDNLETFAQLGFYAVAIDNRAHGERSEPDFISQVFLDKKLVVYEIRRLIKETADDIPTIIDHFTKDEQIDKDRVGMIGVSMGGYSALRAMVIDDRIKVAAPIISSPYWDDDPADIPTVRDPEILQKLKAFSDEYSPAYYLDRFYPRAMLLQVGGKDIHLNVERVKHFHHELESYYEERPDRLKLIIHEGVGHEFIPEMWRNAMDWFKNYL